MDKFIEEDIKKLVSRDSYNSLYPENFIPENKVTKENNNVDISDIDLHLDYILSDNEFDYMKEMCLKKLFNKYGQYENKID